VSRPRIRSLKPEIWQHEKIGKLTPEQRLLFLGLVTMADDEGRLRELPSLIIGHVFPYDQVSPRRLGQWLHRLAQVGLIERYSVVDGEQIIQLHGWHRHQRINRPNPSDLPTAPTTFSESGHDSISESGPTFSARSSRTVHHSHAQADRRGSERMGEDLSKGGGRTDEGATFQPPPDQDHGSSRGNSNNPVVEVPL
jgi:hypothetical protein